MSLFFVLGGEDNEMSEIKKVLKKMELPYFQPQLGWGKITVEMNQLPETTRGKKLVFVECRPGKSIEKECTDVLLIDHHDEWREKPAALLQMLTLLGKRPTVRQQMVATIDSNFLAGAIEKWPSQSKKIWEIWEGGYKKRFERESDYEIFKGQCEVIFENAVKRSEDGLLIIFNVPSSYTLLAAMADVRGMDCCFCVGSEQAVEEKPCFYCGNAEVVTELASLRWPRQYWGRRYLGCRALPRDFVREVRKLRRELLERDV